MKNKENNKALIMELLISSSNLKNEAGKIMITGRIKILPTLFLLVISTYTFPQEKITEYEKRITITTGLYDYLPDKLNSGNFNIGAEINLKGRKSLAVNLGYIESYGPQSGWFIISTKSNKGIKIQIEGRHYLNKHELIEPLILLFWPMIFQYNSRESSHTGYYIAVSTLYQLTLTEREKNVNNYTVVRNIIGIYPKFGYKAIKKFGFVIDISFGLGIRYIESHSHGKTGKNSDQELPFIFVFLPNKLFDSGSGLFPGFLYTLKIGWSFKK